MVDGWSGGEDGLEWIGKAGWLVIVGWDGKVISGKVPGEATMLLNIITRVFRN